jgi:hypothetical protein
MGEYHDLILAMQSILDEQLVSADGKRIGRVADATTERLPDGRLVLCQLAMGPQALAGRVSVRLEPVARLIFRDRFERYIPLGEVEYFGPNVPLRGVATAYDTGQSERWIARHILRWIPGSGY